MDASPPTDASPLMASPRARRSAAAAAAASPLPPSAPRSASPTPPKPQLLTGFGRVPKIPLATTHYLTNKGTISLKKLKPEEFADAVAATGGRVAATLEEALALHHELLAALPPLPRFAATAAEARKTKVADSSEEEEEEEEEEDSSAA